MACQVTVHRYRMACAVLHNICILGQEPEDEEDEFEEDALEEENEDVLLDAGETDGIAAREHMAQTYFS